METNDARAALLARLIDHAPMFPPASLLPDGALAEDGRAVESPHCFMLGRLVWPASAFDEVRESARPISAVLDAPLPEGSGPDAVEVRYRDDLESLSGLAPEIYVELPLDGELERRLDRLAEDGLRAKVRCGGERVPDTGELARFVRACRDRGLAFKATAGLHHAVRSNGEHGFLNLLAAVVFDGDEEAALAETDPAAFSLTRSRFAWRDRSAAADELARVRRERFHSIGSCSFFEPVEELEGLGVLVR
jgi:predicted transcriptional regulator